MIFASNETNNRIYFDCNATTPILKEASQAVLRTMEKVYGNPSSTHMVGAQAKIILERSRVSASEVIHAHPSEIYFTSGATEAIQISVLSVLKWISEQKKQGINIKERKILISATEHKAIPNAISHWCFVLDLDIEIIPIGVDEKGHILLNEIEMHVKDTIFLCTMAVNNETGVITKLNAIENLIRSQQHHIYWLVDCVQALGKIDLNFDNLSVDYAVFSGHKIHAPKGIGFLYLREKAPQCPLIVGGGQEKGVRSGTENLPGIAAIGVILELLKDRKRGNKVESIRNHNELLEFRNILLDALQLAFPSIVFNTDLNHSVPTTINFSVYGLTSKELMNVFDCAGISMSGGSACNSKSVNYSHVLEAMNFPEWRLASGVRLSFSFATSKEEIIKGSQAILNAGKAFKNSCLNLSCSIENNLDENFMTQDDLHGIIQLNSEFANTWILIDCFTKSCIVIDPTEKNLDRILNLIHCKNLYVQAILDTHSHADHDSVRKILFTKLNLNDNGLDVLGWPENGNILKFNSNQWEIKKLNTPGHTLDSVCYLVFDKNKLKYPLFAFVGDTILPGGLGRTDFEMSCIEQFFHSLHLLNKNLSPQTMLCSAHDYNNNLATSWGVEKNNNCLLKSSLISDDKMTFNYFNNEKKKIDSNLSLDDKTDNIVCGLISVNYNEKSDSLPLLNPDKINDKEYIVIDIRERAESLAFKDWASLNLNQQPINIPMSKITNLMCELLQGNEKYSSKKIILLCSTGRRSLIIAKNFRRLGFSSVLSIDGGVAFSSLKNFENTY
ncbi:aminotransferase class V-fold PLP-dependent enzyme [Silvanigrella aquatica]|uniref:cysteine desulfurase n=1 Tax=Silvanigrella aquatica TaxID=1915309 RepID=A0A1L4D3Y1_9BACT|nr:aminotransferase class V-fold PLP-dependent enzyme [Silvanigrella aquatica]APJ04890.1 hypothetical protein AXG55_13700 [Silvanigrella aquatica]